MAVLFSLRRALLSSSSAPDALSSSERQRRLERVTRLLAQSAAASGPFAQTNNGATAESLLSAASAWCLPLLSSPSSAVAFSGCNPLAAAPSFAWLAEHTADRQSAAELFIESTALDATQPRGWEGVAQSALDAADSLLANRLQHFTGNATKQLLPALCT